MLPFRRNRMALRPIDSVKHIVETNSILAAGVNTVLLDIINGVDTYSLSDTNGVPTGAKVNGFYLSFFAYTEGGELASEVPLVDWYILKSPGEVYGDTFAATTLPTPGSTGNHQNKSKIIHTEKGLAGGGNLALNGVPMVFKGVIVIPKGMRRIAENDELLLCARANFATKVCVQSIYKHYK